MLFMYIYIYKIKTTLVSLTICGLSEFRSKWEAAHISSHCLGEITILGLQFP